MECGFPEGATGKSRVVKYRIRDPAPKQGGVVRNLLLISPMNLRGAGGDGRSAAPGATEKEGEPKRILIT